jgi:hypothetical protein
MFFEVEILSGDLAHGEVWRVEAAQFATDKEVSMGTATVIERM